MSVTPRSPASVSSPGASPASVVARLRAAGCVFAEDEAALLLAEFGADPGALAASVTRRVAGEPLEHVLGWAEFAGQRLRVGPGVFVPRRRTEFLAECAVRLAPSPAVAVDLCCGVGAVGAALLAALDRVEVHASDLAPRAVAYARRNLRAAAGVYEGDLYAPLPARLRGRVDVLVANAPYVPSDAVALLPTEARVHEPTLALDGGADGLGVLRRVAAGAGEWLAPGGSLLVESSERQRAALLAELTAVGLAPRVAHCPEREATVLIAERRLA
ncbi:putative protein N(5)-glutamine methyltransferase [Streptomyces triticirhizae]|uniref:peptide chain release factor N(5)-glutamine methyltransferase n=1 Tax=Streptomyces triticirhizae TaxID=2483353 RepID=A0A3M2LQW9_9ACTN|nr:putative protein N(5)-glutamine methyltransferase [Streptomyces triticirhizae]RMI37258.1 putative protein N(5)-glutamine methyltransferase [Streptomyces triticirhizae]